MTYFNNKLQPIQVPEPCHESWSEMTPVEKGRFCSSCQKSVTDFTAMSNDEIAAFLKQNTQNVCGRIGVKQLEHFNQSLQSPSFSKWHKWKLAAATLTGLTLAIPSMGQATSDLSSKSKQKMEWRGYFHAPQEVEKKDIDDKDKKKQNEDEKKVNSSESEIEIASYEADSDVVLTGLIMSAHDAKKYNRRFNGKPIYTGKSFFGRIWHGIKNIFRKKYIA